MTSSVHPLFDETFQNFFRSKSAAEVLYTTCTKYYPDGSGGWYPVKRVTFDRPIYNPQKVERMRKNFDLEDPQNVNVPVDPARGSDFWIKSFNRARQSCFDYLMCNPSLDTFLTFTVDPARYDAYDYKALVSFLSTWLDNRVRRNGLRYILVPELHKSGAYHFHGIANGEALRLVDSGTVKLPGGKKPRKRSNLTKKEQAEGQTVYNVDDMPLGFSTAISIGGEAAQAKVSKYIWKYMTKQQGAKIGGRYYLHGGDLLAPKLVYSNDSFEEAGGNIVSYGGTACKIESINTV